MLVLKDKKNRINSQGGIYFLNQLIKRKGIDKLIDSYLPDRAKQSKYKDSDIILGMAYGIYCGAGYLEDLNYVKEQFNGPKQLNIPSSDTVKYRITQLAEEDTIIQGNKQKNHIFNIQERLNRLLILVGTYLNEEWKGEGGVLIDYDNTIINNRKKDSLRVYKGGYGYNPGVSFIGRNAVYIEGRNGNSPSAYKMKETLERTKTLLEEAGIKIKEIRIDGAGFQGDIMKFAEENDITYYIRGKGASEILCRPGKRWRSKTINGERIEYLDEPDWSIPGSNNLGHRCRVIYYRYKRNPEENMDLFEGEYRYYSIYTNNYELTPLEIIHKYNERGSSEQNFDRLKNDFNWGHPPFNNLAENTVYFIYTAIASVIYYWILKVISKYFKDIDQDTRIKRFILYFVSLCVKWIKKSGRWALKIYTTRPYEILLRAP